MVDLDQLTQFRNYLKFAADTAVPGTMPGTPSAGHCAVVAYLFSIIFKDSKMVSVKHEGQSHWFNYLNGWYIDLTSDQFGCAEILVFQNPVDNDITERFENQLSEETKARAKLLAERSEIHTETK